MNNLHRRNFIPLSLVALLTIIIAGCHSSNDDRTDTINGIVLSSDIPLVETNVTIYSSSIANGQTALGAAVTDANGMFSLSYSANLNSDSVIYLTTDGGQLSSTQQVLPDAFVLAVVIGTSPYAETVTLNERTTVASAFALAQYIDEASLAGKSPGLQLAAKMLRNLVDIETGAIGPTIMDDDNMPLLMRSTARSFNEMANLIASCATDADICDSILQLALPLDGPAPSDTFRALANMAATPWRNPVPLFELITADFYQPNLGPDAPSAWTLALKFKGNPKNLAGPGNMAFDEDGQMWIINNLVTANTYILPDCSSQFLFKMDPTNGSVKTYTGGGVLGAGFGIAIHPENLDVWLGNYGFKGTGCPTDIANDSVSQFAPDGTPLSPDATQFNPSSQNPQDGGWTNGGIGWPQGTAISQENDVWIASCNGGEIDGETVDVTIYREANPDNWQAISEDNLEKPFDIAFDTNGVTWVSGTSSDNILAFSYHGEKLREYDLGNGASPMGLASDRQGNIWVSLSGAIDLPCPEGANQPNITQSGIAMVNLDGVQINTRPVIAPPNYNAAGGLTIAWGIAVDGSDNIWVANFTSGGLTSICGAAGKCPDGVAIGEALSPDPDGYYSNLLDRNTGVEIDSSGNVWLANNWKDLPLQNDPVGDSMVVYIGLATPVKTPLSGTPRQP